MESKVNILFPVEIISRELDFRLFLASLFAREQVRIWIGQSRAIYGAATCMEGGLYVGKNIFGLPPNITWHRYHNLKKHGFRFIHLDEEGAIYRGGPESWRQELRRRFDPTQLAAEDYICTWGDFQRDFYRSLNPACRDNIRTTGHPRFDLYKPGYREYYAPEAAKLRERYGDFVLINSNLHRVNHHNGLNRVFSERLGYYAKDAQKRTAFFERWQHLTQTHVSFVRLINRLSIEFPHINIVVRPHPSENKGFYKVVFGEVSNVHTVREGSVGAWLLACRAMIHDGCTTGLEAHLAQRPIINFKPVADEKHDAFIPNLFGERCVAEDQVVAHLKEILNAADGQENEARQLPDDAYAMLDNFRHESFPRLVAVIEEVVASMQADRSSYAALRHSLQDRVRRVENTVKSKLRAKGGEKLGKFVGLDKADVAQRFALIEQVTGKRVNHTLHANDLISVEAAP
jgi:surface carbohydrate biosynthesis protein